MLLSVWYFISSGHVRQDSATLFLEQNLPHRVPEFQRFKNYKQANSIFRYFRTKTQNVLPNDWKIIHFFFYKCIGKLVSNHLFCACLGWHGYPGLAICMWCKVENVWIVLSNIKWMSCLALAYKVLAFFTVNQGYVT